MDDRTWDRICGAFAFHSAMQGLVDRRDRRIAALEATVADQLAQIARLTAQVGRLQAAFGDVSGSVSYIGAAAEARHLLPGDLDPVRDPLTPAPDAPQEDGR